ncbi:MAG: hypothetical protein J6B86_04915 [Clostridia bacterium]|nr:hypothetical protein [Clostridia bacterium]
MTEERPLEELAVEAITLCNTWDANPYLKEWNFPKKITTDLAAFALTFAKDPEAYYKKFRESTCLKAKTTICKRFLKLFSTTPSSVPVSPSPK